MPKILVVDDEKNIRDALEEFLIDEGYEVDTAENGEKALTKINSTDYDLLFLDIKMPGIDGIETLHEIRKTKPKTKVVIITGMPDEYTFDRAISVSPEIIQGFLPKPFKPEDIRKCLQTVLVGEKLPTFQLTKTQAEALNKVGQNFAQNCACVFGQILQREIKINLQKIEIISLHQPIKILEEGLYVKLSVNALGKITGKIIILIPWQKGLNFIDLLEKRAVGITKTYDTKGQTTLKIAGNLLSGAYLNTITQLLKSSTQPSLPELTFETKEKIYEMITQELSPKTYATEYIFTIHTAINIEGTGISLNVLFIPDIDSVKYILHTLGALV